MIKIKKKYRFNTDKLIMEQVENGLFFYLQRIATSLLLGLLFGGGFFFLFFSFFPSPREKAVAAQRDASESQYEILNQRLNRMQLVLSDMEQRDDNLYRVIFQADPIPMSARVGYVKTPSYYDSISRYTNSRLVADITKRVDIMENAIYAQAKSYNELIDLTKDMNIRMECLPAIQPILNKDLTHVASGYGKRIDPIYHTVRFHHGMDFTAPTGTDVYATGNATVEFSGWRQGFGNCIILNHGYNYKTLYAHLKKSLVRAGKKVHRGDVIALVGNTGKSTGPHLHYEVHYKDQPVDPRNFYFQDLSPEQYDKMVQLSNNFGNLLD